MSVARKLMTYVPVILIVFLLAGCATNGEPGTKTTVGALGGGAVGGLLAAGLGASPAAIAGSVILGGLVGGAVGNRMDAADRREANEAAARSLETATAGTTASWSNPDSGNSGTFTPTRTYQNSDGSYCREYQQTVIIGGEEQKSYGTACRQSDGTWKIMN
jgi:surface antigen